MKITAQNVDAEEGWRGEGILAHLFVIYARAREHPFKLRIVLMIARTIFKCGVPMYKADNGARIRARANDFIGWSIIKTGSYEPMTIGRIRALLRNGGTFVDVGANFGLHSSIAANIDGVVTLSIEGHPNNFLDLRATRQRNKPECWEIFCCAVAADRRFVRMQECELGNSGKHRVLGDSLVVQSDSFSVPATTLNEAIDASRITTVTVMKIDVEGYEMEVLKGLDLKGRHRPHYIILELNSLMDDYGHSKVEVCSYLSGYNYSLCNIDGVTQAVTDPFCEDNALFVSNIK